jgi:hypothetical protein
VRDTDANRALVVRALRELRPQVVIAPPFEDHHPDHMGVADLVRQSFYLCGIRKFQPADAAVEAEDAAAPLGLAAVLAATGGGRLSAVFEQRMRAVRCYQSQFGARQEEGFPLRIAAKGFLESIEATLKYFGSLIGVAYGEPYRRVAAAGGDLVGLFGVEPMERPLGVAIICHPTIGGSGVVAAELGMALAERGHEVHVVSYLRPVRVAEPQAAAALPRGAGHALPAVPVPALHAGAGEQAGDAVPRAPDRHLHAHYAIPHAVSAYLCRQMLGDGAPKIVTTLHGTDITLLGLDESFYEITRFSLQQSDGVTAVSGLPGARDAGALLHGLSGGGDLQLRRPRALLAR